MSDKRTQTGCKELTTFCQYTILSMYEALGMLIDQSYMGHYLVHRTPKFHSVNHVLQKRLLKVSLWLVSC